MSIVKPLVFLCAEKQIVQFITETEFDGRLSDAVTDFIQTYFFCI